MRSWSAQTSAPPEVAWRLISQPGRWSSWAPHVRGAWGLGAPEVEQGRIGFARLLGVVPVAARITRVTPGLTWSWCVGLVTLTHTVDRTSRRETEVTISLEAPGPLEPLAAATYGQAMPLLLRRLAREAEREAGAG